MASCDRRGPIVQPPGTSGSTGILQSPSNPRRPERQKRRPRLAANLREGCNPGGKRPKFGRRRIGTARRATMNACLVGWAHTPFGKLEGETVESLIVRVATGALADAGVSPADVDEIVLGHFNAGFSPQDFTAALVLQASPDLALQARNPSRERLRHRLGGGASGTEIDRRRCCADRAGGRRGTNDHDARCRDRQEPAQGVVCAGGGRYRRRLCRHLRPHRRALFPEIRRPVGCARVDRRQEPPQRRRQSICPNAQGSRLRVLPAREREESFCRGAAEAHRLLAGVRRRRRHRPGRCRDRAGP